MKSLIYVTILSLVYFLPSDAQDLEQLISEAEAKDRALDTKGAFELYRQAEAIAPDNVVVLLGIAKQYGESMVDEASDAGKKKAGEMALAYSKKALNLAPENSDANLAVSISYGRLLDYIGSKQKVEYSKYVKQYAEEAIRLNPKSDYAWHMLGRWNTGVAELSPVVKGIAKMVYGGIPQGSYSEAISAYRKAIALNPERLVHQIEMGITLAAMGRTAEAKAAIEKGISMPVRERDDPSNKKRGREALSKLK
ncbi:MAG: hypothetical protein P1U89_21605 [Verrucomicrobiales bacterium]|nr:hypothetical protein [Verrucomicrobiales bacterium]